jgi:hypothetical protein
MTVLDKAKTMAGQIGVNMDDTTEGDVAMLANMYDLEMYKQHTVMKACKRVARMKTLADFLTAGVHSLTYVGAGAVALCITMFAFWGFNFALNQLFTLWGIK